MKIASPPSGIEQRGMSGKLPELGKWKRRVFMTGSALALSVYFLHYAGFEYGGGGFENDVAGASSAQTLPVRLIAVILIVLGLTPIRLRLGSAFLMTALYCAALASFLAAWAIYGATNDTFFLNTVLQLPVLIALSGTQVRVDFPMWFRFVARFLAVQALVDVAVVATGKTLWGYGAFVGGVGNPSSFGLLCALMCAFCLLHPQAGRDRRPIAVWLAIAAIMTKSLFAVLAIMIIAAIWASRSWRRMAAGIVLGCVLAAAVSYFALGSADDNDPIFVANKLGAAVALLGFTGNDKDASDSGSVSARLDIHQRTYEAVRQQPTQILIGHFQRQVYWPMDSQILTYLGSFGLLLLVGFLSVHLLWTYRAWHNVSTDGGFGVLALLLFTFIFFTNRILDYFPMALVYFICVMASRPRRLPAHNDPAQTSWPTTDPITRSS